MILSWGKPRIWVKDLDTSGADWVEVPTPAEDTTELVTTAGDKIEAKIEGGENEDVRVKRSTYQLNYTIRKAKNRTAPIASEDGVVVNHYAVMLQPEDASCVALSIDKSTVSVEDTFTAADGAMWVIHHDALKPASGNQVKWGTITVGSGGVPAFTEAS